MKSTEYKSDLDKKVAAFNAIADKVASAKEAAAIEEDIEKLVDKLNDALKTEKYASLKAEANPIEKAIEDGYITLYRVKDDVKDMTKTVFEKDMVIDLASLMSKEDASAFNAQIETLTFRLNAKAFASYRKGYDDMSDAEAIFKKLQQFSMLYKASDEAKALHNFDPLSNKGVVSFIQEIVDSVLFVGYPNNREVNRLRVDSRLINFIDMAAFKRGREKGLVIHGPKPKTIKEIITIFMYAMYNGKDYRLACPQMKE